jgi:ATP:corrinoid adenosyltransferase
LKRESHEVRWNVQVYTGNCKGKTHSDSGDLALRAAGAGLSVAMAQFVKRARYSELTNFSTKKL